MSIQDVPGNNKMPLYLQISDILEKDIQSSMSPGDCLLSETGMAQKFGVNRHTIRRAIDQLIAEGIVDRRHGLGSFVLNRPLDYPITRGTRFTETLERLGKSTINKVLQKKIIAADGGVARRLEVEPETEIFHLETLRLVDNLPFCLISHFLPREMVPEIDTTYKGESLHAFIAEQGIKLERSYSLISAILPQKADALILEAPLSQPLLRVKSVNINQADLKPVEYSVTRFRSELVQLQINP